jgi:outer membrane lipoprotein carrier protein
MRKALSAALTAGLLSLVLVPAAGAAEDTTTTRDRAVSGLQAWLDGTSRLEATFRQSLISSALGTKTAESGRMYLERPGRLRWDYLDPERKTALLIGEGTTLYLEEDQQMIRGHLDSSGALFPRLLAGRDRVTEAFDARLVGTPASGGDGAYRLRLVPRGEAGGLSEVTLVLKPETFAISGAEILDEAGNRTTYVLGSVRRNGRLPDGIFAFEPPPGTEIVDQP